MQEYDAVIVGAGPAGGQCARDLAKLGARVLLIDRAKSFQENNYSSGGAPMDILSTYELPESVVGTYWNTLKIFSTKSEASWTAASSFGPIIDFDRLRAFLAGDAVRHGATFHLGCRYERHEHQSGKITVDIKENGTSETFAVQTKVLVDATGSERKVLAAQQFDKQQAVAATGIEHHIEVDEEAYRRHAQSMNFYLGHHWMPQGYAWIFPMAPNKLKVGVIRYFEKKQYVPHDPSHQAYLQKLLNLCAPYKLLDRHGKTIYYTASQKDRRLEGSVLAIGDAISSINPLGWEGLRHAMASGRFAAQAIDRYLSGQSPDFHAYQRDLNRYFGYKWKCSELMMGYLFKNRHDGSIDYAVESFKQMNCQEIMSVIFDYRFRHTLKSFFCYFVRRVWGKFNH